MTNRLKAQCYEIFMVIYSNVEKGFASLKKKNLNLIKQISNKI